MTRELVIVRDKDWLSLMSQNLALGQYWRKKAKNENLMARSRQRVFSVEINTTHGVAGR